MNIFKEDNQQFEIFTNQAESVVSSINGYAKEKEIDGLKKFIENFKMKTEDFYRENRKLNIGVVGQVKAGKSSFLNTLLFDGKEILPKASTPKTATLTKMEYSEQNVIQIEYYSEEEWEVLEDNATMDLDDEIYTSAREIIDMAIRNQIDPKEYLEKGVERIEFDTYEDLIADLNDYVGEDGKYTPIVKDVVLYLNKEEFKGLSIVDTPGLNDPIASRTLRTKEFMEVCDVVFFLSQSGSFLDKSDWNLLSSQLPQKGVKKLVLIASKYDSGIRDILKVEDDIFGEDENSADNIPKACKIIRRKLRKRAKGKVKEFIRDLESRGSSPQLIKVIEQCKEPIMISALAYNMSEKDQEEYSAEEKNIYAALKQFSTDMQSDLKLLGNFEEVQAIFDSVVAEKQEILEEKAKSFIPMAKEEFGNILRAYLEKTNSRIKMLQDNDKQQLEDQKKIVETQIGGIRADIAALLGELNADLESEKMKAVKQLREASKEYLSIKDRTGTMTKTGSYVTGHLFWKKTHHYTYEENYSYCIAADAIENIRKFGLDASNQVEEVFSEAVHIKEIKRKLLNIVVNNFDMGSEKYDSSLFRIMVEETISQIEFPIFDISMEGELNSIANQFQGEITSANKKTELLTALSKAISKIYSDLCNKLNDSVRRFKKELTDIGQKLEANLLTNINEEFEQLLEQCKDKDKEIADSKAYAKILEEQLSNQ